MRSSTIIVSIVALVSGISVLQSTMDLGSHSSVLWSVEGATRALHRQPGCFVPNLGQWDHPARFVHRSGPMTLFLEDRGWVIDLVERPVDQKINGLALRMTFEGETHQPEIVGENELAGFHNYFLGCAESGWRTAVPLYSSVRYERLYPGIDLRLRERNGVPEYDLLLQPGAALVAVKVHVEGGQGMSIASDGSLVIATALGPVTQSVPKTWQVGGDGRSCEVVCNFTLLGADRFGFEVPAWDGVSSLTIDPGLIWSTYLGGSVSEMVHAVAVDARGVVTTAGTTSSRDLPTTIGAYDRTVNSTWDVFVSRLDPNKNGAAQLVYCTYLGGNDIDAATALSVDASGVVTVVGTCNSTNFPTSTSAYDTTRNGGFSDTFVTRLDPNKVGAAQLVYSTYLGGSGDEGVKSLSIDAGIVTVSGSTTSTNFPVTSGAYNTRFNGGRTDVFVSRLDLGKSGRAQLVYSTFLGGNHFDHPGAVHIDSRNMMTVAGSTASTNFPTTSSAFDRTHNGYDDIFVCRLDLTKTGGAQLAYSTFFGGLGREVVNGFAVATGGVVTISGGTNSNNYPTTSSAYDATYNGVYDAFVTRLDPSKTGAGQLVYSTYLGGWFSDTATAFHVDAGGVVTLAGTSMSPNFPTTVGAYDRSAHVPPDVFVSRLDPSKLGAAQLRYSTYLGGNHEDYGEGLAVDASGVVTVVGMAISSDFPTTTGAFRRMLGGGGFAGDAFISRIDMGVALYGDVHEVTIRAGGTQRLAVNAGKAHANRLYWIFGSITGTKPGINLPGVHIPLNPDLYTDLAMATVNSTVFTNFKGRLDANGLASAMFNVPANLPVASGFTFHHAYVVYNAGGKLYLASNAVPLRLR